MPKISDLFLRPTGAGRSCRSLGRKIGIFLSRGTAPAYTRRVSRRFIAISFLLGLLGCVQSAPRDYGNAPDARGVASDRPLTIENPNARTFDWPVDAARMSRGFLPNKRRPHLGIDLAAPKGTAILSAQNGFVVYRGRDFHGFGKMVLIDGGNGWATLYAHLDKFYVEEGQRIRQGEMIGAMGRTGRATGVHLHFEIRQNRHPVDPLLYLPRVQGVAVNSH